MNKDLSNLIQLTSVEFSYFDILLNLVVCILATFIIRLIYNAFALTTTNKEYFSRVFPLYSISIFLIITVIQSSLALSLGLVGALSIIRFRTAIKEPEQLIYLLMSTGISIGTGAGQYRMVIAATVVFSLLAILSSFSRVKDQKDTVLVIEVSDSINLDDIRNVLNTTTSSHTYLSMKKDSNSYSLTFSIIEEQFDKLSYGIKKLDSNCSIEIYRPQ
ncbi:DUF4956 domain-containing protein [bacterium]|nr:DUF4956 domain-containing protein [bacterium]